MAAGGVEGAQRPLVGVALEPAGVLLAGERLDDVGVVGDDAAAAAAPGPVEGARSRAASSSAWVSPFGRERRDARRDGCAAAPTRRRPPPAARSARGPARPPSPAGRGRTRLPPRRRDVVVGAHARGRSSRGRAQELVAGRVPVAGSLRWPEARRRRPRRPRRSRAAAHRPRQLAGRATRSKPRWLGRPVSGSWCRAPPATASHRRADLDRLRGQPRRPGGLGPRSGVRRRLDDEAADGAPRADQRDHPAAADVHAARARAGSSSSAPSPADEPQVRAVVGDARRPTPRRRPRATPRRPPGARP